MQPKRSPISLDVIEILAAVAAGVLTALYLPGSLRDIVPFPYQPYQHGEPVPEWFTDDIQWVVRTYTLPIVATVMVAAIALVRVIRDDVGYVSRLGHLAMTVRLVSPPMIGPVSCLAFFVGITLAIVANLQAKRKPQYRGNYLALVYFAVWLIIDLLFTLDIYRLTSD